MLCQNCHKNNATQYYMGNWNGTLFIAGLCSDCEGEIARKAALSGYGDIMRRMAGIYPGKETPRADGSVPFPEHADPALITRARVNDLKRQLQAAADREDYSEAARLRDAIQKISQEEGKCYES